MNEMTWRTNERLTTTNDELNCVSMVDFCLTEGQKNVRDGSDRTERKPRKGLPYHKILLTLRLNKTHFTNFSTKIRSPNLILIGRCSQNKFRIMFRCIVLNSLMSEISISSTDNIQRERKCEYIKT